MTPADKDRQLQNEQVNRRVAEDVAVGMAAKADAEQARADVLAADNVRRDAALHEVRRERDVAATDSAIAREEARGSAFGFWLLLGLVAVALLIGAVWYANRPEPVASTTVINRTYPVPAPNPPTSVQVQAPAPSPPPAPVVIERERPAPPQPSNTIVVQPGNGGNSGGNGGATSTGGSNATPPASPSTGE